MSNIKNYSNAINLLSLWATPKMWHDNSLYIEIRALTNKLRTSSFQLSERELFLSKNLMNGLIEATLNAMDKADDFHYDELNEALDEITQYQSFLLASCSPH